MPLPFAFVLDELEALEPQTRPMFGCTSVYIGERIVLILRDKPAPQEDNGVWIATTVEHHASLKRDFKTMRSIALFETPVTGWQVLPADTASFESDVLRVCKMIAKKDPRIGKIPKRRKKSALK